MTTYYSPYIAVANESTVLTDAEIEAAIPAFQHAVTYNLRREWGSSCHLAFVQQGAKLPAGAWLFQILDTSDQAGALAYHDVDGKDVPTAKIFAKTEQQYGASWTVSFTHELFEALGDPVCLAAMQISQTEVVALELCDPCEADELGYYLKGGDGLEVLISDFVTRNWFVPGAPGPWDHTGNLKAPLALAPGGYVSIGRCTSTGIHWTQSQARKGELVRMEDSDDAARFNRVEGYRTGSRGKDGRFLNEFVHRLPGQRVDVVEAVHTQFHVQ